MHSPARRRRRLLVVIGTTLVVLTAAVVAGSLLLRARLTDRVEAGLACRLGVAAEEVEVQVSAWRVLPATLGRTMGLDVGLGVVEVSMPSPLGTGRLELALDGDRLDGDGLGGDSTDRPLFSQRDDCAAA